MDFKSTLRELWHRVDWVLFFSTWPLLFFGLVTMYSFVGDNHFAIRQFVWILISFAAFFVFSLFDWRVLKRSLLLLLMFVASLAVLAVLFFMKSIKGAQSWFDLGAFSIQPVEPIKLLVIIILAKYFSRRHVEIANFRHIFVSGAYAFIPLALVLLQPDFGSASIIFFIWLGMIMVSGVSKKHLFFVFLAGVMVFAFLWMFMLLPHQKQRIITFADPTMDIRGSGYNAFQSQIAVGGGEVLGKGIGYGTQSRLKFLPEYQTDFIFAAFAEEWGFVGVLILFVFFGIILWRILRIGLRGATNFEMLYGAGLAIFLASHFIINVGMNIGILPVTGITLPFLSYGGSHLLTEFIGLGILTGMASRSRATHRDSMKNEFVGPA